jgi:uncharacterized protein YfaS (alpha-2-macroglobulin family)
MQAWAVLALARAQSAGFAVAEGVLQNAAWMTARALREGPAGAAWGANPNAPAPDVAAVEAQWWRDLTAGFGVFALSGVMHPAPGSPIEPADVDVLVDHLDRLGAEEQQFLALALETWSLRHEAADRVAQRTLARAEVTAEFAQLPAGDDPGRAAVFRTPARATALGLCVAAAVRPQDPLTAKLASGLLRLRTGGHWVTTQDDALALLALDLYRTRSERASGAVDVRAVWRESAQTIAALQAPAAALVQRTGAVELTPAAIPGGRMTLAYEGTGPLHAAAALHWNEDGRHAPAVEAGYGLERHIAPYEGKAPLHVGDLAVVTLDIVVPRESQYLALVDPLPGGLEIVQAEFRTESQAVARQSAAWSAAFDAFPVSHVERDDHELRLFADAVPAGVYTHRYVVRVRAAGRFLQLPARMEAMYAPELHAATASTRFAAAPPPPAGAAPPKNR